MSDPNWSPAPEAVEAAGRAVLAQGSALVRSTFYAKAHLEHVVQTEPADADMANAELGDIYDLIATLVYTLQGLDLYGDDAPELSEGDWGAVQGWLLAQFPH